MSTNKTKQKAFTVGKSLIGEDIINYQPTNNMNDTNNASQTLFRFASMRNAELSDPKNKKRRFIFRNYDSQKGFIDAKIEAGESLKKIVEDPTGLIIETEESLKEKNPAFYELAVWVARNKASASKQEFDAKINDYRRAYPQAVVIGKEIWDNLIYQVITQKDFYAKEILIQFLHLNHILLTYDGVSQEQYEDVIGAKVVLPKEIFKSDESTGSSVIAAKSTASQQPKVLYNEKNMNFADAKIQLQNNENLASALKNIEKDYRKDYQEAYQAASDAYETRVAPLKKEYRAQLEEAYSRKQVLESRIDHLSKMSIASPELFLNNERSQEELRNLYDELGKVIPPSNIEEFDFKYQPEVEARSLQSKLTEDQFNALNKVLQNASTSLEKVSTFEELNQFVSQSNQALQQIILDNTVINEQVSATVGGVVVPVSNSSNTNGWVPYSVKTSVKNNTEWFVQVAVENFAHKIVSANYKVTVNGTEISSNVVFEPSYGVAFMFYNGAGIPASLTSNTGGFILQGEVVLEDGKTYNMNVTLVRDSSDMNNAFKQGVFKGSGAFILKAAASGGSTEAGNCLPVLLRTRSFQNYSDRWLLSMTPRETTALFSSASGTVRILDNNGNEVQSSTQLQVAGGGDYLSLFSDGIMPQLRITEAIKNGCQLEAELTLDDGKVYTCKIPMTIYTERGIDSVTRTYNLTGEGNICPKGNGNPTIPGEDRPFIPSGFGMKNIGITDYKKVEQSTYCYVEGDVAHIENIMAREYKERATRRLRRSESQTTVSSETEKERLTDTTSTERHEMQSEIAKILQESKDFSAQTGFSASWKAGPSGSIGLSANASYATHNSKEESTRQAVTEAKDITARALDRIVAKIKEERIDKIIEEYEENNKHGFDNTKGNSHVVGVFRWVDKIVKNQIYNYGKRMMFEFMVPEPAKLHNLGMKVSNNVENQLVKPVDPRKSPVHKLENFASLDGPTGETVLKFWLGKYNIETNIYNDNLVLSRSYSEAAVGENEVFSKNESIDIPEGYAAYEARLNGYAKFDNDHRQYHSFGVSIGQHYHAISENRADCHINNIMFALDNVEQKISVSYHSTNYHAMSIGVNIYCKMTPAFKKQWLNEIFNKIIEAYQVELAKYESALADAKALGVQIKGSNPGFYRKIENTILRRNCISYMLNQSPNVDLTFGKRRYYTNDGGAEETFTNTDIKVDEKLDQYAAFIKFMEQAFEWEIMSYYFYPYYWGERKSWADLYQFDDNDPTFRAFMQSGMARVIVTVRPGFEEAVRHFLTTGQIWNGGEVPVIDDPLFLSIVDELRSPKATKEGEPWREKVPTTLTILQADSIGLKVEKALPCHCEPDVKFDDSLGEMCGSNFEKNNNVLGENTPGEKWIEISFDNMDKYVDIAQMDHEQLFPRVYECLGNTITIDRDASWFGVQSSTVVYKALADEISNIEGVMAFPTGNNGLTFKIDVNKIKTFTFTKPGGDNEHDRLKFSVDLNASTLKIVTPVYFKYGYERILDRNGKVIPEVEYQDKISLNKFLV